VSAPKERFYYSSSLHQLQSSFRWKHAPKIITKAHDHPDGFCANSSQGQTKTGWKPTVCRPIPFLTRYARIEWNARCSHKAFNNETNTMTINTWLDLVPLNVTGCVHASSEETALKSRIEKFGKMRRHYPIWWPAKSCSWEALCAAGVTVRLSLHDVDGTNGLYTKPVKQLNAHSIVHPAHAQFLDEWRMPQGICTSF
jgi:hypothetical protein